MKIDGKTLAEIQEDTEVNDHCGALLTAAKALDNQLLIEQIERLIRDRDHAGGLDADLSRTYRNRYLDVMALAKKELSPADFRKFYDAF